MKRILFCILLAFSQLALFAQIEEASDKEKLVAGEFSGNVQTAMSNPDYVVTAGDVYSLSYAAGDVAVSYTIPVDSTYKIRVSNLAVLNAKGKTYLSLKKEVEDIVVRNYPMSGVQFVLLNPATFSVIVTGEVSSTQERPAWSLTRVGSVLSGLTPYSSTRNVTIKSIDGKSKNVDLFKASRFGDMSQNPYLRPGDTIVVNRIDRKVTINGAVERSGIYEILPGENLKQLIEYYGNGYAPLADSSRIELTRTMAGSSGSGEKIYLNQKDVDSNYELECYDTVTVYSYSDLQPVMFIEGAVGTGEAGTTLEASNRVAVNFTKGENYAYLVRSHKNYFGNVSDTENAYILRKGEIIPINLNQMLYDASFYSDLTVEDEDVLNVPFRQFFITVAGAVNDPGRFPFIPDRSFDYYIGLAGGFDTTKNKLSTVKIVDVNGKKHKKSESIQPEYTITAETNSGLYYFNQYAPVVTTILSVIATSLSVMAATGAL